MTTRQTQKASDKSALGKGLKALIGAEGIEPADRIDHIDVNLISPNPNQPRRHFDEMELRELTESLAAHGLLQPIVVTRGIDGSFVLVAGERRLIAAKAAGWNKIPGIVRDYDELKSLQMALVENIQRENLNDMELAHAYRGLGESHGLTHSQIARLVGKSRPAIANTLRLLDLPEMIQEGIIQGKISAGHARALLSLAEEKQALLFSRIVKKGLSVREVERIAAREAKGKKPVTLSSSGEADFDTLARGLEDRLHRRVKITRDAKGGKVTIHFKDDKDLNELLSRLQNV